MLGVSSISAIVAAVGVKVGLVFTVITIPFDFQARYSARRDYFAYLARKYKLSMRIEYEWRGYPSQV
jgi:hypothetical protein